MRLLFLTLIICSTSLAQTIRLDSPGQAMEHVPVINQGNLGICFSASAAQMIDAYRFTRGTDHGHLTSPIEAAISMKAATIRRLRERSSHVSDSYLMIDGGNICEVANHLSANGVCPTSSVPFEAKTNVEQELIIGLYTEIFQRLPSGSQNCSQTLTELFPELGDIGRVLEAVREQNLPAFLEELLYSTNCAEQRLTAFNPKCTMVPTPGFTVPSKQEFERVIDERLAMSSPQPVGISYCSTVLTRGSSYVGYPVSMVDGYPFQTTSPDCGNHASLIIGKREIETRGGMGQPIKVKQYLIRNSWGVNSQNYSWEWEHDQGNIWVNAEALINNLMGVSFLDPQ